ncbi:MAG: hypothetical protein RIQ33_1094 [Bacteroidota bacterium]|jgi:hypothetical protein
MKQKHFFSLIAIIAFMALYSNTSDAHRGRHIRHQNYVYYYIPPPPIYYYNYQAPSYYHPHHPHHYYRGCVRRW